MTHLVANQANALLMDQTVSRCLRMWKLSHPRIIATTNTGVILRVTCSDGCSAVLKCLSEIGMREESQAALILEAFDGLGAVCVYESTDFAILMEDCAGPQLDALALGAGDAFALPIICDVVRQLHHVESQPPPDAATLQNRCMVLKEAPKLTTDLEIYALLERADRMSAELLSNAFEPTLLHGDLHHANILQTLRGNELQWVCIDPQGIVGDRAYDEANVFGNPVDQTDLVLDPERPARLAQYFSDSLGLDQRRVLSWAFVHANISAAWSLQDGDDPNVRLKLARNFEKAL